MKMYRFLTIIRAKMEVEYLPIDDLVERIKHIEKGKLLLGYDIHAGFNIPSNAELRELLERLNIGIRIDLAVIDERRQSNYKPYCPTSVYAVIDGKEMKRSISGLRHAFVSEIPLKKEEVLEAYRELLGSEFPKYSGLLEKANGKTIGDFLTRLTKTVLEEKLTNLGNVDFGDVGFDRFSAVAETPHPVERHKKHDIVYMGRHKAACDKRSLDYLVNRFTFPGEMPYFIVIPLHPEPYFKI